MANQTLTTKELADLYRFKPETIRRWFRMGRLRATREGNQLRFRREDVDAAMNRGARPAR